MTGIQALERAAASLPMKAGQVERREFEYVRHGTQALIAAFDVASGTVRGTVGDSRTEADYVAFLRDGSHRIVFHFTPKHASRINQIEIWFSILVRKLLRRGNFTSKENLKQRIDAFIAYFNATMTKPFRWTMKGKPLTL